MSIVSEAAVVVATHTTTRNANMNPDLPLGIGWMANFRPTWQEKLGQSIFTREHSVQWIGATSSWHNNNPHQPGNSVRPIMQQKNRIGGFSMPLCRQKNVHGFCHYGKWQDTIWALYVTVKNVEEFVEEHFQDQIVPLRKEQTCPELLKLLEACCEDEVHHKEDAARHLLGDDSCKKLPWWAGPWAKVVKAGSALAADVARRI
ncbi:MAG: hypothetical protein SGARI_004550 [Bacillariaceae sp.]